jgi:hypothetical protein
MSYDYNPMRATSNHGYTSGDPYAHPNVGYVSQMSYNPVRQMAVPGSILGYSKDGFPIRAAYVPGTIIGYAKDGSPIHAASIIDDAVCGGSSLLFIGLGLAFGWLAADGFASYMSGKR